MEKAVNLSKILLDMGCDEVVPSDTIGTGTAKKMAQFMEEMRLNNLDAFDPAKIAFHFHGNDLERVDAGLENGVTRYDSAFLGLGGCPVITKAKGNLPTISLVKHLERKRFSTGVDLSIAIKGEELLRHFLKEHNITQSYNP